MIRHYSYNINEIFRLAAGRIEKPNALRLRNLRSGLYDENYPRL